MPEMIKSVHEGMGDENGMIEKPARATFIYGPDEEPIYTCPYCKKQVTIDECDCLFAEPGCVFCFYCSREFET